MAISNETRKRLRARSGNRCAQCKQELIRADVGEPAGALVGQEAHIVARSPGGPRYEPLDAQVRDGYDNLILLCANDHVEVDAQPSRYPVDRLRQMKREHEQWVSSRLQVPINGEAGYALAVVIKSGTEMWDVMGKSLGYQCGSPDDLTDDEAELVDSALQTFVDWGEISPDVEMQGFRAIREAKRSMQSMLDELKAADFAVLGGEREGGWAQGQLTGKVAVVEIVRAEKLSALRVALADGADS